MPAKGGTRVGGFPLWVWAVAGFGAIAVGLLLLRSPSSSQATPAADASTLHSLFESTPLLYIMVAPNQPVTSPPPPDTSPPNPPPVTQPPPTGSNQGWHGNLRLVGPPVYGSQFDSQGAF